MILGLVTFSICACVGEVLGGKISSTGAMLEKDPAVQIFIRRDGDCCINGAASLKEVMLSLSTTSLHLFILYRW
jgi:hypothetical protein